MVVDPIKMMAHIDLGNKHINKKWGTLFSKKSQKGGKKLDVINIGLLKCLL